MADKYIIKVDDDRGNGYIYESETCNDLRDAYIISDRLRRKYEEFKTYSHVSIDLNKQ